MEIEQGRDTMAGGISFRVYKAAAGGPRNRKGKKKRGWRVRFIVETRRGSQGRKDIINIPRLRFVNVQ
jgi:hypothetical protein